LQFLLFVAGIFNGSDVTASQVSTASHSSAMGNGGHSFQIKPSKHRAKKKHLTFCSLLWQLQGCRCYGLHLCPFVFDFYSTWTGPRCFLYAMFVVWSADRL